MEDKEELVTKDELLPDGINSIPLTKETTEIVTDIINTKDSEELKSLVELFAINQAKKNALRVVRLNALLDAVNDQAIERFEKRPDEISNQELLQYMKVVQEQIKNSQEIVTDIENKPMLTLNQQNNEINISVNSVDNLSRESRENVVEAIQKILQQVKTEKKEEENIVDVVSVIEEEK